MYALWVIQCAYNVPKMYDRYIFWYGGTISRGFHGWLFHLWRFIFWVSISFIGCFCLLVREKFATHLENASLHGEEGRCSWIGHLEIDNEKVVSLLRLLKMQDLLMAMHGSTNDSLKILAKLLNLCRIQGYTIRVYLFLSWNFWALAFVKSKAYLSLIHIIYTSP